MGESEVVEYVVTVSDGIDSTDIPFTVTVTILGKSGGDPTVVIEDTGQKCIKPPNDALGLEVTPGQPGPKAITIINREVCINTTQYELLLNETELVNVVICVTANCEISDDVPIIVVGVNDPPTAQPIEETYLENDGQKTINVLSSFEDVDGRTPRVVSISYKEGDKKGITPNKNILEIDTNVYVLLSDGIDEVPISVTINIIGVSGEAIVSLLQFPPLLFHQNRPTQVLQLFLLQVLLQILLQVFAI